MPSEARNLTPELYRKFAAKDQSAVRNLQPEVNRDRIFEAWLVTRLDNHRAVYCTRLKRLYFVDTVAGEIGSLIRKALNSMQRQREIHSVRIDGKGYFAVGQKVTLRDDEYAVVGCALRIANVRVEKIDV